MEKAKLIWDFRGSNAKQIAIHHSKHLAEFIVAEGLDKAQTSVEEITPMHHSAIMIVDLKLVNTLRERLRPNRGQRYSD